VHVCGLGVIRSLGLKDFQIIAMSYDETDFSQISKHVYERVKIPHPCIEEKKFIDFLIRNSYRWNEAFLFRKIRQNPPKFGVARVGISQDRIPQIIEEFTERILKEANFKGIANAEFKKYPRDNQFKLLEINVRAFRSNWLATYCGINFPWIIYMDLVEKNK